MNAKQRKLKAAKRKHHNTKPSVIKIGSLVKIKHSMHLPDGYKQSDKATVVYMFDKYLVIGHKNWHGHKAASCIRTELFSNHELYKGSNLWHVCTKDVILVKS